MAEPLTQPLVRALDDLRASFEQVGAKHMIIGGLAVIARGVVRHTDDADATVWAPDVEVSRLIEALEQHGIVGRIRDVAAFAAQSHVLLLIHTASGVPLDVTLAWLPFEHDAIERAETVSVSGLELQVATAEDLVIYKAIAWRERDRHDIDALLRLHDKQIDREYVRARVREFAEAIEEPERLRALEAIFASVDRAKPR